MLSIPAHLASASSHNSMELDDMSRRGSVATTDAKLQDVVPSNVGVPTVPMEATENVDSEDVSNSPSNSKEKPSAELAFSDQSYLGFLQKLYAQWQDCPDIHIQYQDLRYNVQVPVVDKGIRSFVQTGVDGLRAKLKFLGKLNPKWRTRTKQFNVLGPVSGRIAPGTMTLLLTPPGHGKSTFLRALAGRLEGDKCKSGSVLYNGLTKQQAEEKEVYVSRLCAYVGQTDVHFPVLTVRETFDFAAKNSVPDPRLLTSDPALLDLEDKRADLLISLLGLDECANTIIGSELLRGVSGGQRRRVTIGEMLITNARVLFMDEVSTGLDAAVTFHIFNALHKWVRLCRGSIVTALLQPTPEVYNLFDDIMLMRDGRMIYHGPRAGVRDFFQNYLGLPIPADADEGGFVVDYLNDPQRLIKNLKQQEKDKAERLEDLAAEKEAKEPASVVPEAAHPLSPEFANPPDFTSPQTISPPADVGTVVASPSNQGTWVGKDGKLRVALSTKEMLARYDAAPYSKMQRQALDDSLTVSKENPAMQLDTSKWSAYTRQQFGRPYPHGLGYYTKLDMVRQAKLTFRNKQILLPRAINSILMGLIFGSLFYQLAADNYSAKMGLLLYSVMFGAFANLSELPIAAEARNVVTKQLDAGFFPTFPFIFSNVIWAVPKVLIEAVLFGTLMYWLPGLTADAGRFLYYIFVLFLCSASLSTFFRTISFVAANPDVARQMDFPFIIIFVIFGGFLIAKDKIPNWLIWLYWLDPLQWAVTSLALNEFGAPHFDAPLAGETVRRGDKFLGAFSITTNQSYRFASIGYLFLFFFFFVVLSAFALKRVRGLATLGTKRLPSDSSLRAKQKREAKEKEAAAAAAAANGVVNGAQPNGVASRPTQVNIDVSVLSSQSAKFGMSALPFTPVTLSWKNIKYTVQVVKDKHTVDRVLLRNISGFARPGSMTALMGSSGAGKTTLMDVIAGRKTVGQTEGEILVNGRKIKPTLFNRLCGYVEQQDLHMGLCTVREALQFSALLRLPSSVERVQREQWVDEVMGLVGLSKIAGRLIGDSSVPGLSPGQLKLLTIGVELVANPSVLFLDEPTSGLDAPSAFRVMSAVRRIADTGRSVLCTIHQPSAELFFAFDRLLLLRSGGEDVFFSDIGPQGTLLVKYFEEVSAGKAPRLPHGVNPANWMLDVIGAGVASAEGGSIQAAGFQAADYVALWKQSPLHQQSLEDTEAASTPSPVLDELVQKLEHLRYATYFRRLYEVQMRYFVMHWRNAPTNLTRIMLMVIIGLLLGVIYLNISTSDFQGAQSLLSVIFLGLAFPASVSSASAFPSFFRQRAVYYRENTIGMYDEFIFSTSLAVVEIVYIFFALPFFLLPFYFMVGLESTGQAFFKYFLVIFMMGLIYSSLSQLWMALLPSTIATNVVNGFFMSMFFMFGGLFIQFKDMPIGWRWFTYIDPIPKALISAAAPQFFCDTSAPGNSCPQIQVPDSSGTTTQYTYDYITSAINGNASDYGKYIGYLVLTWAVIRLLVWIGLKKVSHLKR